MVKLKKIAQKNKKGVSEIIGYVLLISFGIVLSVIVYGYLKSYVPKDLIECPEGTSVFLKQVNCSGGKLNITLKNNGRFTLAGYYIHSSPDINREIATDNMAPYFILLPQSSSAVGSNAYILFDPAIDNAMAPGSEFTHSFSYLVSQKPAFIEITPVRFEDYEGNIRFASCGNAKLKQVLTCS